jgi:hypothetical protein
VIATTQFGEHDPLLACAVFVGVPNERFDDRMLRRQDYRILGFHGHLGVHQAHCDRHQLSSKTQAQPRQRAVLSYTPASSDALQLVGEVLSLYVCPQSLLGPLHVLSLQHLDTRCSSQLDVWNQKETGDGA